MKLEYTEISVSVIQKNIRIKGGPHFGEVWRNLARNEKKASERRALKPLIILVGRAGIEPAANGLKVRCSTAELTAHCLSVT